MNFTSTGPECTTSFGRLILLYLMAAIASACNKTEGSDQSSEIRQEKQWLVDVTDEVGLDFIYEAGATGKYYMPEIVGSGVGLFDYDNDGDLDICLTNGNLLLPDAARGGSLTNRLFRMEADGTLTDVTEASGLGDNGYGMGLAVGDIDNDGDLDIFFTNFGPDRLYLNLGDGTFRDVTEDAGIDIPGWSTSAAFFDFDRDGYLDLYICQYSINNPDAKCYDGVGRPTYCSPKSYRPVNDVLLHNNGDGTFRDVTEEAGLLIKPASGLGVICEDLDNDGWIDMYVANDGYMNHLWINQHDGTFLEFAAMMGCAYNLNGKAEASMGMVVMDYDNDLDLDVFITHLKDESNTLYTNDGQAFLDDTNRRGLSISSLALTGFGVAAFDVECDGDLDLAIVNGRVSRRTPHPDSVVGEPWNWLAESNLFYLNDGAGHFVLNEKRFTHLTQPIEVSRGLAVGDLDGDGDLDLVVTNVGSRARMYRNDAPKQGRWLLVKAVDPRYKRDAYHARLTLSTADRAWVRTINPGSSYQSSIDPRAHFGLGSVDEIESLEVLWPDGLRETFKVECLDCAIVVRRGEGVSIP